MKKEGFWNWSRQVRSTTTTLFCLLILAGFLWGFFLKGFFLGLLFAFLACEIGVFLFGTTMVFLNMADDVADIKRQINNQPATSEQSEKSALSMAVKLKKDEEILKNGGWKCEECNKVNPKYTFTCSCGNSKH